MLRLTPATKITDIKRNWHLVDAKGRVSGRLATEVARFLMGKNKTYFVRNLDCGDYVVVINAQEVKFTGKKEKQKVYYRHSGYPGGLRTIPVERMRKEHPERIIEHAVRGMLPQNKLRDRMLMRLKVFAGEKHPYQDKFKVKT